MKKSFATKLLFSFVCGIVLLPASQAFAARYADESQYNAPNFSATTYYSYGAFGEDVTNKTTNNNYHLDTTEHVIGEALTYSFNDRFSIRAQGSYSPSFHKDISTPFGTSPERDSNGFLNPTFGATWRAIPEKKYGAYLDALVDYTPDIVEAKTASSTSDGTMGTGGQEVEFGFEIGRNFTNNLLVSFRATGVYDTSQSIDTPTGTATSDELWNYRLSLDGTYAFNDNWFTTVGVDFNPGGSQNGADRLYVNGDTANLNVGVGYNIVPNQWSTAVNYTHSFALGTSEIGAGPGGQSFEVRNVNGDSVMVSLTRYFSL